MFRHTIFALCTTTLFACGGADDLELPFDDSTSGPELHEDLDLAPATGELEPESDEDDDPPEPAGRITFVADEDGDLIVHASIAPYVAERYSDADHYELRLGLASRQSIVTIVDEHGELLERIDLRQGGSDYFGADQQAMKVYSPFPWLPDLTNCTFAPCPTLPTWPQGAELPDHLEISTDGHSQRIRGVIGETELAAELYPTDEGFELLPGSEPPSEEASQRLSNITYILADVAALAPELEPVDECLDCIFYGFMVSGAVTLCTNTYSPYICEDAGEGVDAWLEECPGACQD